MAEPAPRRATWADLEALPEGVRGELIQGVLYALPRPRFAHQRAGTFIAGHEITLAELWPEAEPVPEPR